MAENKTRVTNVTVADFLDQVQPPQRQDDARVVCELMQRLSGNEPRMWGPSIIGFGVEHYRTPAGREGDVCRIGFSPRKPQLVFYIGAVSQPDLLAKLGKHSTGKGCLYIKRLADIDSSVLEALIQRRLERGEGPDAPATG